MKTAKEWKVSVRVGGQKRLVKFLGSCRALDHGAPAWHFDRYRAIALRTLAEAMLLAEATPSLLKRTPMLGPPDVRVKWGTAQKLIADIGQLFLLRASGDVGNSEADKPLKLEWSYSSKNAHFTGGQRRPGSGGM